MFICTSEVIDLIFIRNSFVDVSASSQLNNVILDLIMLEIIASNLINVIK